MQDNQYRQILHILCLVPHLFHYFQPLFTLCQSHVRAWWHHYSRTISNPTQLVLVNTLPCWVIPSPSSFTRHWFNGLTLIGYRLNPFRRILLIKLSKSMHIHCRLHRPDSYMLSPANRDQSITLLGIHALPPTGQVGSPFRPRLPQTNYCTYHLLHVLPRFITCLPQQVPKEVAQSSLEWRLN